MKRKIVILSVLVLVFLVIAIDVQAQCPMCRMSAESNLREGGTEGAGLNRGILYMLSLPYLLVATLGFLWYKNRRKLSDELYAEPFSEN